MICLLFSRNIHYFVENIMENNIMGARRIHDIALLLQEIIIVSGIKMGEVKRNG